MPHGGGANRIMEDVHQAVSATEPFAADAPDQGSARGEEQGRSLDRNLEELRAALAAVRDRVEGDPYANPIALLSLEMVRRLTRGRLDDAAAEALIQRLTREAFLARAS